jgi:hypothetical protein
MMLRNYIHKNKILLVITQYVSEAGFSGLLLLFFVKGLEV